MKKPIIISIVITALILFIFLLYNENLDAFYRSLESGYDDKEHKKRYLAILYFSFLLSDIVLPIPSTIIMTEAANALGFVLSLSISVLGLFCSNMIGYFICKCGVVKFDSLMSSELNLFFKKYGFTAIIITRSIPILPELIAFMAGLSKMRVSTFAFASVIGAFPIALYCSCIGSFFENRTYEMFLAISFSAVMLFLAYVFKLIKK